MPVEVASREMNVSSPAEIFVRYPDVMAKQSKNTELSGGKERRNSLEQLRSAMCCT